ncbi:MAG: patatin-like phospholipase family protein [Gammaproteobacteria bacterium]
MPNSAEPMADWLAREPYTLVMSSGFFSFFAHCGLLAALEDADLLPQAVAGSSAGALTGSLWAAGLSPEAIAELYFSLSKGDFWDPAPGFGLLRGRRFRELLRRASPSSRLEDCRRPVQISAFDLLRLKTRVLASGDFADSVYASCAVPLMFHPIRSHGGWLVDGGLADRPGLASIEQGRRVLHHHISNRSPWRTGHSAAMQAPRRNNMVTLVIDGLPQPGPNALNLGRQAWHAARLAARRALRMPMRCAQSRIDVDPQWLAEGAAC